MTDIQNSPEDGAAITTEEARGKAARLAVGAGLRHAAITKEAAAKTLGGGGWDALTPSDALAVFQTKVQQVKDGDMAPAVAYLMAQAISLDAIFTQMAGRAAVNVGEFPQAVERYMRLALKAQANSRATLEAIAKISRGGEQIVRHIHVDNRGGQAVIAETVHTGGHNAIPSNQPHAFQLEQEIAMRSENAFGDSLQELAHAERPLQDARRDVTGSAQRQSERVEARGALGGDGGDGEDVAAA